MTIRHSYFAAIPLENIEVRTIKQCSKLRQLLGIKLSKITAGEIAEQKVKLFGSPVPGLKDQPFARIFQIICHGIAHWQLYIPSTSRCEPATAIN